MLTQYSKQVKKLYAERDRLMTLARGLRRVGTPLRGYGMLVRAARFCNHMALELAKAERGEL